jgi:hypothetical protein
MARLLRDMNEPEMRHYFNLVGRATESILPEDARKFVLLVFDDPGLGQYVGNCERSDIIKALRETADRLEAKEDIPR